MLKKLILAVILAISTVVPQEPPCTTSFTVVNCSNCPRPSLFMCWGADNQYSVFGTVIETWCNYTPHDGWCTYAPGCTTVSSITTSKDCHDTLYAASRSICCSEP